MESGRIPGAMVYARVREREYAICGTIQEVVRRCRRISISIQTGGLDYDSSLDSKTVVAASLSWLLIVVFASGSRRQFLIPRTSHSHHHILLGSGI